jgi:hypothetical protein
MQSRPLLLIALLTAGLAFVTPRCRAIPLFNGVDLTGWTKRGGAATYHVDNGEIVGISAPPGSPNTFLTTNANFSDFVLELDFKIFNTPFNSGVQIRSQSLPTHANGRVFGYQVEIDPAPRAWSGGLYFEGGSPQRPAGWLDDLSDNQAAREAFDLGEWNHFRIVAIDRRIRTWINDVAAADFTDNHATGFLPSGFVGLQVHNVSSGSPGPFEVRWRNINLAEALSTDFDVDGDSDADDLTEWRLSFGDDAGGDADGDGDTDGSDFLAWQRQVGSVALGLHASTTAAPEPSSIAMAGAAGLLLAWRTYASKSSTKRCRSVTAAT